MYFTSKFKEMCLENNLNSIMPFFKELSFSWIASTKEVTHEENYLSNVEWLLNATEEVVKKYSQEKEENLIPLRDYDKFELFNGIKKSWRLEVSTMISFYWENQHGLREYWSNFMVFINSLFYESEKEIQKQQREKYLKERNVFV